MSQPVSARWLAPVALLGALIAVIVTIAAAGGGSGNGSVSAGSAPASTPTARTSTQHTTTATTTAKGAAPHTYTVQPGDVLSAIADKTGVPLSRIEQLNPTVDAQSLHAGQKLKLAP